MKGRLVHFRSHYAGGETLFSSPRRLEAGTELGTLTVMSNARSRQLAYFKDNIQTQDDQVRLCLN